MTLEQMGGSAATESGSTPTDGVGEWTRNGRHPGCSGLVQRTRQHRVIQRVDAAPAVGRHAAFIALTMRRPLSAASAN